MKTTYNGTYSQVYELQNPKGKITLIQKLKVQFLHDSFVRANFLTGARFLQTLKDSTLLTIDEVIETPEEVSIVCKNDGFQQLGVYLATQNQLSDSFLVELIKKIIAGIDTLHKNSIFHQGLNPNSFAINSKEEVKLTLFGTLEHRLYHQMPSIGSENPSIQNAIRFYSPERKVNYGAINLESEYYSIGLIIWYLKCVQLNLANTKDLVLNFPDYASTGSVWDEVIEACLQVEPEKRPKSAKEIIGLLPKIEKEYVKKEEIPYFPKQLTLSFFNYNSLNHEIKINGKGIENYEYNIEGQKLTILVNAGLEVQVFNKETGSLLTSFSSSKLSQYTLPNLEKEKTPFQHNTTKSNSQTILYIIIVALLLFILLLLFIQFGKNKYNASDNTSSNSQITNGNSTISSEHDTLNKSTSTEFPYSDIEIKEFINNYYNMINNEDLQSFENYFEPVVEKYFLVTNGNRSELKQNYADWLSKFSTTSMIHDDLIRISKNAENAKITVPLYFKSINLRNGIISEYEIAHEITLTKNLRIKKLTEKILRKY